MRVKEQPPALREKWNSADADFEPDCAGWPLMARRVTLDVRGMEPPEPMQRVLEAIDDFVPGDLLVLVIDCEPAPLFRILERNGYAWRSVPGAVSLREITIWRAA